MVVMFQVKGLWVAIGYQRFGGHCCLHLQGERKYPTTISHGVATQKTSSSLLLVVFFVLSCIHVADISNKY
jgi:hypothetical protein